MKKNEIVSLLQSTGNAALELHREANDIRKKHVGDSVFLRGIIEFSNHCRRNCLYCGINKNIPQIQRYQMSIDEIIDTAKKIADQGISTIVLQSGEDPDFDINRMIEIISKIKRLNVRITLSTGEYTESEYKALKEAGADRFLLRIETSNKSLYRKLHPGFELQDRIKCLEIIRKSGYEAGTGSLIGLPGQTIEDMADDLLFYQDFQPNMMGSGPFIAHQLSKLKDHPSPSFDLAMNFLALQRILNPDSNIAATTALDAIYDGGRFYALESGANVFMPNFTYTRYQQLYTLYPNKERIDGSLTFSIDELSAKLNNSGKKLDLSFGDSKLSHYK